MTNIIEKARSNRALALRMHALRSASITNVFGPVPIIEDAAQPVEHKSFVSETAHRIQRSTPKFISTRQMATSHAA